MDLEGSVDSAIEVIERFGSIDGSHHKQWVIDQVLRCLLAEGYELWRADYEDEDEDGECCEWDEGIAP